MAIVYGFAGLRIKEDNIIMDIYNEKYSIFIKYNAFTLFIVHRKYSIFIDILYFHKGGVL